MLKNYIKLAWRILGRRKFFTFISLFGISFTLGILMLLLSFLQNELGSKSPLVLKNDMVIVQSLELKRTYYDTILTVDTSYAGEQMILDSNYAYNDNGSSMSTSSVNCNIFKSYLNDLSAAKKYTLINAGNGTNLFVNGVKLEVSLAYTDANYWEIFNHQMLEGRTFDENEAENSAQVIVISDKTANEYFGSPSGVVGEEILLDEKNYKVIGVYKHKGKVIDFVSPNAVLPYTNMNLENQSSFYHGSFSAIFQRNANSSLQNLKQQIKDASGLIPLDHPDNNGGYTEGILYPKTYNEMFAQGVYWDRDEEKSLRIMKFILFGIIGFFVLLPTLNLINLNISRILERSSEIGVRKAFGAHQGNIMNQFIIENIVQTILGGIIGLILALVLIRMINKGGMLGDAELQLSPKFYLVSIVITLFFGILSGLLPAYRMSKLQIVQALKDTKR